MLMKVTDLLIPDNKIYAYMGLYPGKTREEVKNLLVTSLKKRIFKAVPVVVLLIAAVVLFGRDKEEERKIQREDVNGVTISYPVTIKNIHGEISGYLQVDPVRMSDEEIDLTELKVESLLDEKVVGNNISFGEVMTDLVFPEELEGFPVLLVWSTSDPGVIRTDGRVINSDLQDERHVTVCAKVIYGEEFRLYERDVTVVPMRYDERETSFRSAFADLQKYEQTKGFEKEFFLPDTIKDATFLPGGRKKVPVAAGSIMLVVISFIFIWKSFYSSLEEKRKKRALKAESDCKEFLSRLSILLTAGLPLRSAWKKMTDDYAESGVHGALAENMSVTCRELMNGSSEKLAYERFGERMENTRYQRIAAILSQAVTKGVSELPELLNAEMREALADEREKIKIRGEQAGTKLLLPMTGFLIIVFALLLVPAFRTF